MANVVKLRPVNEQRLLLTLQNREGSPMVQHKWSEKAKEMMRRKKSGKKTKAREACDPQQEGHDATYLTEKGEFGIDAMAIKSSIIGAAHKDLGIEKTLVKKALFIHCKDKHRCLPMRCAEPTIREDHVRLTGNTADLRYRPEFSEWEIDIIIDYDADLLKADDIVNLINRAGFGVGIGEWRPEKGGDWGRYQVKPS